MVGGTSIAGLFTGLAADTKPVGGEGFGAGARYMETDSGKMFIYDGSSWNLVGGVASVQSFNYALKGSLPSPAFLIGNSTQVVAGLAASDATERMIANAHLRILVNSLTGNGSVTITGDSLSELTGIISVADTENITVDAIGNYHTSKKWLRITAVTIPGGITAINYDLWRLSYFDQGNTDFKMTGYRLEVTPTNKTLIDFRLEVIKIKDDGAGKITLIELEDIALSGTTPWIVDNFHATSASIRGDRGYNSATASPWTVGEPMAQKQTDFDTEFAGGGDNIFTSMTDDEGYIIKITWSNADFMNLAFFLSEV